LNGEAIGVEVEAAPKWTIGIAARGRKSIAGVARTLACKRAQRRAPNLNMTAELNVKDRMKKQKKNYYQKRYRDKSR
jgi:hypothetical protein